MSRPRSPLFVLFLTVFIDLVGFGIIIPVLPLYAEHFHASPVAIGWLTGIYSGMQIIFTPILGKLSDRFGRRPVLMVSIAGTAIGFALMGMATALPLLFVARILAGITGGNISIPQAYIADVTAPEQRSRAMGMIGAAFGLGFTFGPLIGGVMSRISYSAPFYFAAGLAVANALLVYLILPESLSREHRVRPHADASIAEVFRHGRGMFAIVVATYFFLIAGFSIMTTLFALFTEKRFGYDARANGYLFGFIGILTVVVQGGLIGRLVKIFGEVTLARVGMLLTAASLAILPFSNHLPFLLLACAGLSFGSGFASPPLSGLASQMIDRSWQGRALGVMQSAGSTGRLLGPLLGGWLLMFDLGKPIAEYSRTPFLVGALLCFVGALLALCLKKRTDDRSAENIAAVSSA
ncbi:MAG: tetracycline resistance MFS efflux pump [Verrucomicrobia bacterium]|nr:MAG: tetracycline resistance MFS efflux pump [Verrucomicrobiota bacterium]